LYELLKRWEKANEKEPFMPDYSKNRVLALYKILINYTDEQHQISMQDILGYMEAEGHFCSEDSILRYIKQLRNELGVDVISSRGRNAQYFIGDRLLEKEEMRLIIDSVNASNFIEKSIATKMIDKLKSTMSIYDSEELDRNVLGINIAKAENRKILYNVNLIQEALNKGVQISFDYMGWNRNKKLVKKSDRRYNMNPWALICANDRYYLYGYDVKETQGVLYERHYRVDKLDNIILSEVSREGKSQFRSFNANTYVSRRMGMFSGREQAITVRIPENLVGAFIDQFGKRITITEETDGMLLVTFNAVASVILLGWIIGLKCAEVVAPENVREDIKALIQCNLNYYNEKN
jgi:predicted DNA-binding transcriptional regulator YafY